MCFFFSKKVWVEKVANNVNNSNLQGGGGYKEAVLRGGGNEHVYSFDVGDDIMNQYAKAMVGEVHWPGKSYSIQDEFIRQGVFSIKATTMGANLVLLEGHKDDEDFMGFVEEAKDWLFQWFKWIRPWKVTDVDNERVAWVRCFEVPMHVWNVEFFLKNFTTCWYLFVYR